MIVLSIKGQGMTTIEQAQLRQCWRNCVDIMHRLRLFQPALLEQVDEDLLLDALRHLGHARETLWQIDAVRHDTEA